MILNILEFNPDITLLVLYSWLDRYDVSHLDVAYASRTQRPLFLKLLASPYGNSNWVFQKSFRDDRLLLWLARRRVAIHQLKLINIGNEADFTAFPHYCRSLRIAKFNNLRCLEDEHIGILLGACGSIIESISIVRCADITLASVNAILTTARKSLISLHLEGINHRVGVIDASLPTSLQHLCVREADNFSDRTTDPTFLSNILAICPLLRSLHMGLMVRPDLMREPSWLDTLASHCAEMREITFDFIAMNTTLCQLLPVKLPHLHALNIPTSRKMLSILAPAYVGLGQFCQLQKIVTGGHDANAQMLAALCVSAQSSLLHVEVLAAIDATSELLHTLAMLCPNLQTLILPNANVNDEGVEHLLKECQQLRMLHLCHCYDLTKKSLEHVKQFGHNMEDLSLFVPTDPDELMGEGNVRYSIVDMHALVKDGVCKKLVKLNVGDTLLNDLFRSLLWKKRTGSAT
eukprot:gene32579-39392_t